MVVPDKGRLACMALRRYVRREGAHLDRAGSARNSISAYQDHLGVGGWVLQKEPAVKVVVRFVLELRKK